jgi:hypothetical protein
MSVMDLHLMADAIANRNLHPRVSYSFILSRHAIDE